MDTFLAARLAGLLRSGAVERAMMRGQRKIPLVRASTAMEKHPQWSLEQVTAAFTTYAKNTVLVCGRLQLKVEQTVTDSLLYAAWQ